MAATTEASVWDRVKELTKAAQRGGADPLRWAMEASFALTSAGVVLPSPELAHLLVSHICWDNNVPTAWKLLDKALSANLVPPMLVIALLSLRVIPHRWYQAGAYRLYLELTKRHALSFAPQVNGPNYHHIVKSIDLVLQFNLIFGHEAGGPGILLVEFVFSIVWMLLDASLDDEGLLEFMPEKELTWLIRSQEKHVNDMGCTDMGRRECVKVVHEINTLMAIQIIDGFFKHRVTSKILYLACRNIVSPWGRFIQRLRLLAVESMVFRKLDSMTQKNLQQLSDTMELLSHKHKSSSLQKIYAVKVTRSLVSSASQYDGVSHSALWLPIDLFMEDSVCGFGAISTCGAKILTGLVKTLQAVNNIPWHDTLLGLWLAALRLFHRGGEPSEAPFSRLDNCTLMLLSVTPLAIASIIEENENIIADEIESRTTIRRNVKQLVGLSRNEIVLSLQLLGDYKGLLAPPATLASVANQAAAKATMFLSGFKVGSGYLDGVSMDDMITNCCGNLWHLIVEACISRDLLDTLAYNWPGYVSRCGYQVSQSICGQVSCWSSLMQGSPLTPLMIDVLVSTPAPSLAEIKRVYEIAVTGSEDEKVSAATILCGGSLTHGWNFQEHTLSFILRLLSPAVPADHSGTESYLTASAPLLSAILASISAPNCLHAFYMHGLVPQLAAALVPICEVFGSCVPSCSWTLKDGEEMSAYAVFSYAFVLLLRLWKFCDPPFDHAIGTVGSIKTQFTPEYILSVRNSELATSKQGLENLRLENLRPASSEPMLMSSFSKLKLWYQQHQAFITSTLPRLGTPVQQIVGQLLNMMFGNTIRSSNPMVSTGSGSNSSSGETVDVSLPLKLPPWDILEALPFVLDAALTACSCGSLSPRELTTGLRDLVDFLPASLATILSYFSAEIRRGMWKPVLMNGTDWPSPAANLSTIEHQLKELLISMDIDVSSIFATGGSLPATIPLPLAALLCLTITYKASSATGRLMALIGPPLHSLAGGCPWPSMPIIIALWSQKVKFWQDFFVFRFCCGAFPYNKGAVVQLLQTCFSAVLGCSCAPLLSNGGVGTLLGDGFDPGLFSGLSGIAPGMLYLRMQHSLSDVVFLSEKIISLIVLSVKQISTHGLAEGKRKLKCGMKDGQVSLAAVLTRVKLVASLGASLLWLSGGVTLVRTLICEALPSWLIGGSHDQQFGEGINSGGISAMLGGYALAYFTMFCGAYSWGVDSTLPASKWRPHILGTHFKFIANVLDRNILPRYGSAVLRAYVCGFVGLIIECTPNWIQEVDVDLLKRLSKGMRQWNEEELALALLEFGGISTMGAAAELIIESSTQVS